MRNTRQVICLKCGYKYSTISKHTTVDSCSQCTRLFSDEDRDAMLKDLLKELEEE
jgi:hypothetical protein